MYPKICWSLHCQTRHSTAGKLALQDVLVYKTILPSLRVCYQNWKSSPRQMRSDFKILTLHMWFEHRWFFLAIFTSQVHIFVSLSCTSSSRPLFPTLTLNLLYTPLRRLRNTLIEWRGQLMYHSSISIVWNIEKRAQFEVIAGVCWRSWSWPIVNFKIYHICLHQFAITSVLQHNSHVDSFDTGQLGAVYPSNRI